jgi:hypothetical protein
LSVDKCSVFVYPSRRLGISSPREAWCISSAPLGLYLITRQRAFCLRLDDIQCYALVIYRNKLRIYVLNWSDAVFIASFFLICAGNYATM